MKRLYAVVKHEHLAFDVFAFRPRGCWRTRRSTHFDHGGRQAGERAERVGGAGASESWKAVLKNTGGGGGGGAPHGAPLAPNKRRDQM